MIEIFSKTDRRYIQFKSFLEGSFYTSQLQFLIYVTSNRRHLMKRDMLDNERSSAISQDKSNQPKVDGAMGELVFTTLTKMSI